MGNDAYVWENGLKEPSDDELKRWDEGTYRTVQMVWLRALRAGVASAHRQIDTLSMRWDAVQEARRTRRRGNIAFWTGAALFGLAVLDRIVIYLRG